MNAESENDSIQSEEWVVSVFLSLRVGDEVYINDRERPFTVESRDWDNRESGYWRYTLLAHGTEYRGVVCPPKQTSGGSFISTFETDAGTEFLPTKAKRNPDGEFIVSNIRADEWLEEAGIDVE